MKIFALRLYFNPPNFKKCYIFYNKSVHYDNSLRMSLPVTPSEAPNTRSSEHSGDVCAQGRATMVYNK